MIRQTFKVFAVGSLIILFLLNSSILGLIFWNEDKKISWRIKLMQFYSRLGLRVLNVHVDFLGQSYLQNRTFFMVSNHMSYLDVMIYAAYYPTRFVTSMEIKKTPILGWLCEMGACLYVERRSRENLGQEIVEIEESLKKGYSVTVFPEATSTNGEQVLRFKSPLYNAAIRTQTLTVPLCLNYTKVNGRVMTKFYQDSICWYGRMPFFPHLLRLARLKSVHARVATLGYIAPDMEAKELSQLTWKCINQSFTPIAQTSLAPC